MKTAPLRPCSVSRKFVFWYYLKHCTLPCLFYSSIKTCRLQLLVKWWINKKAYLAVKHMAGYRSSLTCSAKYFISFFIVWQLIETVWFLSEQSAFAAIGRCRRTIVSIFLSRSSLPVFTFFPKVVVLGFWKIGDPHTILYFDGQRGGFWKVFLEFQNFAYAY